MNFKAATDALFERVSHEDLADELGVSIAAIRQARLELSANAHRPAPKGWERAVVQLAENRIRLYHELIGELERQGSAKAAQHELADVR
jgi:DNA-binding GntR family transcriptional regulator